MSLSHSPWCCVYFGKLNCCERCAKTSGPSPEDANGTSQCFPCTIYLAGRKRGSIQVAKANADRDERRCVMSGPAKLLRTTTQAASALVAQCAEQRTPCPRPTSPPQICRSPPATGCQGCFGEDGLVWSFPHPGQSSDFFPCLDCLNMCSLDTCDWMKGSSRSEILMPGNTECR